MARFILDSFALIAYFNREPEGTEVRSLLRQAKRGEVELFLHGLNLCEVLYSMERKGQRADAVYQHITALPITVVDRIVEFVLPAARLKASFSISLPDCFAAVTAQALDGSVVTGDSDFKRLGQFVKIHWLKRSRRGQSDRGGR